MSFIDGTLSEYLQKEKRIIFKGTLKGDTLAITGFNSAEQPCEPNTCNALQGYTCIKYFLTIVNKCDEKKLGNNGFVFALDRKYEGIWINVTGTAYLVNENELRLFGNNDNNRVENLTLSLATLPAKDKKGECKYEKRLNLLVQGVARESNCYVTVHNDSEVKCSTLKKKSKETCCEQSDSCENGCKGECDCSSSSSSSCSSSSSSSC